MDYETLVAAKTVSGSIKSWMNYGKIDSEGVLLEAEGMIFTRLRVREMRTSENLSVKATTDSVDLPDRFLDPILLRNITDDVDIDFKSEDDLEQLRTWTDAVLDTSDPSYYGIFDEKINFDCKASTAFRARMLFYRQPDALSESNNTSFLTIRYPHLVRMGCIAVGARFADDEQRFSREQRLMFAEIDEINAKDEYSRRGQV